jgi:hypothetical protein
MWDTQPQKIANDLLGHGHFDGVAIGAADRMQASMQFEDEVRDPFQRGPAADIYEMIRTQHEIVLGQTNDS